MRNILPFNLTSRFTSIITIMLYAIVGAIIYFSITIKNGAFESIFGNRLLRKLKIKK